MGRSAEEFLKYWEGVRARTLRVAACIDGPDFDWSPTGGVFSVADTLRHLASIERFMYAETVSGRVSSYPGHGLDLADGRDEVFVFVNRCHAEAANIIGALSDEQMAGKCRTPAGTAITVSKWLRAMVEHEAHHRGQIYLLARLRGIETPPLYGLTSEQVRERSVTA